MHVTKSRKQKIEFIRNIESGNISPDQLFISTLDPDRCTVAELNFLHDMLVKGETEKIVIPEEYRNQFDQLKKDYATNTQNTVGKNKVPQCTCMRDRGTISNPTPSPPWRTPIPFPQFWGDPSHPVRHYDEPRKNIDITQ